ncbi:MAG: hypothetical protein V3V98_03615 [Thermoplasmata archaeon]
MPMIADRRRKKLEQKRERLLMEKNALLTKMAAIRSKALKKGRDSTELPAYWKLQSKIERVNGMIGETDLLLKPYRDMERSLGTDHSYVLRDEGLQAAKTYEAAGKHEEAAAEYEKLGLWKEAGKIREKAIATRTTQKVVEIDINQLIEQLRAGDLMATYKCPSCTAPLTVDKNSSEASLKFCSDCGAMIQIQDVAEVVSGVLK